MLIDLSKSAPPAVNDVVTIKLSTGEEIIGRLTDNPQNGSSVTLAKPIVLQLHTDKNGQVVGVSFAPIMITADEDSKFSIKREHILLGPLRPAERFVSQYQQATSSIEVPKSNLVV